MNWKWQKLTVYRLWQQAKHAMQYYIIYCNFFIHNSHSRYKKKEEGTFSSVPTVSQTAVKGFLFTNNNRGQEHLDQVQSALHCQISHALGTLTDNPTTRAAVGHKASFNKGWLDRQTCTVQQGSPLWSKGREGVVVAGVRRVAGHQDIQASVCQLCGCSPRGWIILRSYTDLSQYQILSLSFQPFCLFLLYQQGGTLDAEIKVLNSNFFFPKELYNVSKCPLEQIVEVEMVRAGSLKIKNDLIFSYFKLSLSSFNI